MPSMIPMLLAGAVLAFMLMAVAWAIHLAMRNAGIVDAAWAAGVPLLATLYAVMGPGYPVRKWLFAVMAGIWGFRLSSYLLLTRVLGHEEEGRYTQLRQDWGGSIALKFFLFFEFQGLLDLILSIPFLIACMNPVPSLSPLEMAAVALWALAIVGETLADVQLARYKKDPAGKGKTCRAGLWRYSRHPNYFFEWLIWCANFLFALASPFGWISAVCPLLLLFFLFRVTGIPATEAQALRTRGDDYREYQRTTSAFVPWFPKA